jgi:ATPase family associated with various cellular activities (AAA)
VYSSQNSSHFGRIRQNISVRTPKRNKKTNVPPLVAHRLARHFGKQPLEQLVTASRKFPVSARIDLQFAVTKIFGEQFTAELIGLHRRFGHETMTFSELLTIDNYPALVAPLQHFEVDIGELVPARCLSNGLWLSRSNDLRFALLLTPAINYGRDSGTHLEIAVPPGEEGAALSRRLFDEIEKLVKRATSYRGKVISLEQTDNYSGHAGSVRVHKLRSVSRHELVLPAKTLQLLERNVSQFIRQRGELRKLGMPVKKGLLFYGQPGTGKTHTIHYLASQLPDHTTLLITAEQVGLLDHYFQLARFLQPSIVVIEDVDLIARSRESMDSACEESLLNKLLNEMDGLREDAEVIFVLTTNRPQQLEAAIASRPGRIDQAIEFPLPDAAGRRQLVHLYACGLQVPENVVQEIVRRTENASGAFIKELMRRSAQFSLDNDHAGQLTLNDLTSALDEMLFSGGLLNAKLLGGPQIPIQ